VIILGNVVPEVALVVALLVLLYQFYEGTFGFNLSNTLLPFIITLIVCVLMHMLINLVLPLRWASIRNEFQRLLEQKISTSLTDAYLAIPGERARVLLAERQATQKLEADVTRINQWLEERQRTAQAAGLYGD
jgi:hypothetical protein